MAYLGLPGTEFVRSPAQSNALARLSSMFILKGVYINLLTFHHLFESAELEIDLDTSQSHSRIEMIQSLLCESSGKYYAALLSSTTFLLRSICPFTGHQCKDP